MLKVCFILSQNNYLANVVSAVAVNQTGASLTSSPLPPAIAIGKRGSWGRKRVITICNAYDLQCFVCVLNDSVGFRVNVSVIFC